MFIIKLLSAIAFIGSALWLYVQPDFESAIATITALSTFITVWFLESKKKYKADQHQSVAQNGIGIQAGESIKMENVNINRK